MAACFFSSSSSLMVQDRAFKSSDTYIEAIHISSNAIVYLKMKDDNVEKCVADIQKFITDNNALCPLFSQDAPQLKQSIQKHRFLVVGGSSLCFSDSIERTDTPYRDYFSLSLIEEPVVCEQGHPLELRLAKLWMEKKGDVCPHGQNHKIGSLTIDTKLKQSIDQATHARIDQATQRQKAEATQRQKEEAILLWKNFQKVKSLSRAQALYRPLFIHPCTYVDELAKASAKKRYNRGQIGMAIAERVSGFFTGFFLIKELIELFVKINDLYSNELPLAFTLWDAYDVLGISGLPKKEIVDQASEHQLSVLSNFKKDQSSSVSSEDMHTCLERAIAHPEEVDQLIIPFLDPLKLFIIKVRSFIYQQKGWQ